MSDVPLALATWTCIQVPLSMWSPGALHARGPASLARMILFRGPFGVAGALAVKRVEGVPTVFPAEGGYVSEEEDMLQTVYDCGPVKVRQKASAGVCQALRYSWQYREAGAVVFRSHSCLKCACCRAERVAAVQRAQGAHCQGVACTPQESQCCESAPHRQDPELQAAPPTMTAINNTAVGLAPGHDAPGCWLVIVLSCAACVLHACAMFLPDHALCMVSISRVSMSSHVPVAQPRQSACWGYRRVGFH